MATGDNHQQWGFSQFPQQGQDPGQAAANFVNQGFGESSNDAFAIAQQWQTNDNQFLNEPDFTSYQSQDSAYPIQQPAQHFAGPNGHAQSHQHPQTYTAPLAMNGAQDISWDYGFGFENNSLRGGLGGEDSPYVNGLQQGRIANGLSSTRAFPQSQEITSNVSSTQPQFGADTPGSHAYTTSQNPIYGRNIQQSPPQSMAQPLQQQRQPVDYQQQSVHQHHQAAVPQQQQQPAVSQHRQSGMSQHQPAIAHQQQHVLPQHHQPPISQYQPAMSHHHVSALPQHQQLLQGGSQQQQQQQHQLQNVNHAQQASRIGTPQSHSITPTTQPRQSPFNGRGVPPLSMQQQTQMSAQPGRSSPAIPFSAPQQPNMQMSARRASPSLSNAQTTQTRFVPQHMVPAQQFPQSAAPPTNNVGASQTMPNPQPQNLQPQNLQPSLQGGSQTMQQNLQAQFNMSVPLPAPPQETDKTGLVSPRVLRRDDKAIPSCGSRFIGFSLVPSLPMGDDAETHRTIDEFPDPNHITDAPFGNLFPEQPNGQRRVFASDLVHEWTKAVDDGDVASQTALELRLNQQLGGSLPKYYDDRLKQAASAKKKASAKRGPERSKNRPTDEADAAEWDALGLIYLANPQPTSQEIGEAVAAFGKLIRGYAADMQKLKSKLKTAKDADSAPLQEQVDHKLECIYRAVAAANSWGDPQILANLGGNQKLISDFVTCLIHANNSADHNGKIPRAVLQLLSVVTTIDEDFLMTSLRFAMISKKFDAKGDTEIKDFIQKIRQNAAARKAETARDESKTERTSTSESSSSGYKGTAGLHDAAKKSNTASTTSRASSTTSTSSSTIKRPREEEADTKVVKRVAAEANSSSSGQKAVSGKVVVPAPSTATQTKLFGSGMLGVKKAVPKPTTKPAGKSDGVKSEGVPVAKKEPLRLTSASKIKKTELAKPEAPSASKLGGISALLDSISNAKSKPNGRSTPDKEVKPEKDETPEEKARRLRKEKRRHLRVSWKQGDDLTEVRLFHKDAEEDEGRASNMIRDAHDDRSEGMMLKQGLMSGAQDDEEDEDELPYRPWYQPTAVDFTVIAPQTRSKSFITRAGQVEVETQQQKFIAERDNKELMVVYTDPSDIPSTPKSPQSQPAENTNMDTGSIYDLAQDDPKLAEIHLRWGEANSRGFSWARLNALRRAQKGQSATLSDVANMQASAVSAISNGSSATRTMSIEEYVFDLLTSDSVKKYRDPSPIDPANLKTKRRHDYANLKMQHAADMVENVVAQLSGKPFPPIQPPEWMTDDKANEWWQGYNRDRQRAEHQAQQQRLLYAAQSQPSAQPEPTPQAGPTAVDPNAAAWAAYYAQIQQQQQQQAQPQAAAQDSNAAAWAAYYAQQQQQATTAPAQPAGDSNAQLQAVLAALGGTPTQPQQQPTAQNSTDPQLQALLASLGATSPAQQPAQAYQPQSAPAPFQAPNPNEPNYLAYIMSLAGQSADQAAAPATGNGNRHARDDSREREMDSLHPSRRGEGKTRGGSRAVRGGSGSGGDVPPHLRGINREKIGTKPCTFWAKGTCQKGDQCTFRHD